MNLRPQFESPLFRKWLLDRDMEQVLVDLIIARMSSLNDEICRDNTLGDNFQVGHSYFCPKGINFKGLNRKWYEGIVRTEIIPLLQEYWFDNPDRSKQLAAKLLA